MIRYILATIFMVLSGLSIQTGWPGLALFNVLMAILYGAFAVVDYVKSLRDND